ncbi:MAG: hypothetical protein ACFE9S_07570 [Candidatus Hermodarchaeota archaeon]
MTREELFELHKTTCTETLNIMKQKNQDYSGGTNDIFGNFNACEFLGIPGEIGILVRCMDKFKRIQAFVNTGSLAVKNESVFDAINDVINYMILLKGLIVSKNEK